MFLNQNLQGVANKDCQEYHTVNQFFCKICVDQYAVPDESGDTNKCYCEQGDDGNGGCNIVCQQQCKTCETTPDNCLSCADDSFRSTTPDCNCDEGYFLYNQDDLVCTKCFFKCKTCENSANQCTSCDSDREGGSCDCKEGFYQIGTDKVCGTCDVSCKDCENTATECTACPDNSNRNPVTNCGCSDGYYDNSSPVCPKCNYKCLLCNDGSSCTSCANNTRDDSNNCECLSQYYEANNEDIICTQCSFKCNECQNLTGACDACSDSNRVFPQCNCNPVGFFEQSIQNATCGICNSLCYKCSDANTCTECQSGSNRDGSSCNCINNYIDLTGNNTGTCELCNYKCNGCQNTKINCILCSHAQRTPPNCLCNNGFYEVTANQANCQQCDPNCKTCQTNSTYCLSCKGDRTLNGSNQCVCPDGKYDDGTSLNCQECGYKCSKCSDINTCTECKGNRISTPTCNCPANTLELLNVVACEACSFKCTGCQNTIDECVNCSDATRDTTPDCSCISGKTENGSNSVCQDCNDKCKTCEQNDKDQCILCADNSFRENPPLCPCINNKYDVGGICTDCSPKCKLCSGTSTNCTQCNIVNTSIPTRNNILPNCECLDGYYEDSTVASDCLKCNFICKKCIELASCTECVDNSGTRNADCSCKDNYYQVGENPVCSECDTIFCNTCEGGPKLCLTCSDVNRQGPTGGQTTSQCDCKDTFFHNGVSACVQCTSPCGNCETTSTNCLTCINTTNRKLPQEGCGCLDKFYQNLSGNCVDCPFYYCQKCSQTACTECINTDANRNQTLPCDCKSQFYDDDTSCKPCTHPCVECRKDGSNVVCDTCVNGIIGQNRKLAADQCVCKDNYYENSNKICIECGYPCATCDANGCTLCINPVSDRKSIPLCECIDGKYDDTTACVSCELNCSTCKSSTECIVCATSSPARQFNYGQCTCPVGYFDIIPIQANCTQCDQYCLNCETTASNCLQCINDTRDISSTSKCKCKSGYLDTVQLVCQKCNSKCSTCINSISNCVICAGNGSNQRGSAPNCGCNVNFYDSGEPNCQPCEYPCIDCVSKTECVSCNTATPGLRNPAPSCKCKDTYHQNDDGVSCILCHHPCLNCNGIGLSAQCTSCKGGNPSTTFRVGIPTCQCITGYFDNTVDADDICLKCDIACFDCEQYFTTTNQFLLSISYNNCKQCSHSTRDFSIPTEHAQGEDYYQCPCKIGYMEYDPIQQSCQTCSYKCGECKTNVNNCQSREDPTIIVCSHITRDNTNNCECKDGYFNKSTNPQCFECSYQCKTCVDNADNCTSCFDSIVDYNRNNVTPVCDCQDEYYDDGTNVKCQSCSGFCLTCEQLNRCLTCKLQSTDGLIVYNRIDTPPFCKCQDGFYDNGNTICQNCSERCGTCVGDADNCLTCKNSNRVNPPNCDCQIGLVEVSVSLCTDCSVKCQNCQQNPNKCTQCSHITRQDIPDCACKPNYYEHSVIQQDCRQCTFPCFNCQDVTGQQVCLSCKGSNRDLNNNCACSTGYFQNTDGGSEPECIKCPYYCTKCIFKTSIQDFVCFPSSCLKELDGSDNREYAKLDENGDLIGYCLCKDSYYEQERSCKKCNYECETCVNEKNNCLTCLNPSTRGAAPQCQCLPNYFINDNKDCQNCNSLCLLGCVGPNNNECHDCIDNYFKDIQNNMQCIHCSFPCVNCLSGTQCISCAERDNIQAPPSCKCKVGFYEDDSLQCQPCIYPCSECDKNTCFKCSTILNREDTSQNCICKDTFYDNNTQCLKCPIQCKLCLDQDQCTQCNGNQTVITRDINHIKCQCMVGYLEKNEQDCVKCHYKCGSCINQLDNCLTCSDISRSDTINCGCLTIGTYDDGYSIQCQNCQQQCETCLLLPNNCQTCSNNRSNPPVCGCQNGMYEGINLVCQNCNNYKCNNCVFDTNLNSTKCLTCSHISRLLPNCDCKPGFYDDGINSLCLTCQHPCQECSDQTTCISCRSSFNREGPLQGCICLKGFFENTQTQNCMKCTYPCATCDKLSECLTCITDISSQRQTSNPCKCNIGFYDVGFSQDDLDLTDNCQPCNEKCKSCQNSSSNCILCKELSNRINPPNCVCDIGYFENTILQCELCDIKCEKCINQKDSCQACSHVSRDININCECLQGYIENDIQTIECQKCEYPCLTCEHSITNCIQCSHITRENPPICNCKSGLNNFIGINKCSECHFKCDTCNPLDATQCIQCSNVKRINPPQCQCIDGFYDNNSPSCGICVHPCKYCTSHSICTECVDNINRKGAIGLDNCECLDGFYENNSKECVPCQHPCSHCITQTICTQCIARSNIDLNTCVCLDGYYEDSTTNTCEMCSLRCKTCSKFNECLICNDIGNFIQNLIPNCPCIQGKYSDNSNSVDCLNNCSPKCLSCITQDQCILCPINSYRDQNQNCACQTGYVQKLDIHNNIISKCEKCSYQCSECINQEGNCTSCSDNQNRINIPNCDCKDGYYDNGEIQCQICEYPCLFCISKTVCSSCQNGLNRNPQTCDCLNSYFEIGQSGCQKCQPQCQECQLIENNCTVCKIGQNRTLIKPECGCKQGFIPTLNTLNSECLGSLMQSNF